MAVIAFKITLIWWCLLFCNSTLEIWHPRMYKWLAYRAKQKADWLFWQSNLKLANLKHHHCAIQPFIFFLSCIFTYHNLYRTKKWCSKETGEFAEFVMAFVYHWAISATSCFMENISSDISKLIDLPNRLKCSPNR